MRILIALLAIALLPQPAVAADAGALLTRLAGTWISDGPAFGSPAQSRMEWAPALDGKFAKLDYRIEMTPPGGAVRVFEGAAFYRAAGDGAFWADNSGDLHPIRVEAEESALVAHWGVEGGKQGRTRYELLADGGVKVTDWILRDGDWRRFNENVFTRVKDDE